MRAFLACFVVVLSAIPLAACSFCGEGFARRQPLRARYADAKIVIAGVLKNPVARDNGTGSTEFHITQTLKGDEALGTTKILMIPRYLPLVADTPPDYLFFCSIIDGKIEATYGQASSDAIIQYLAELGKKSDFSSSDRVKFFFSHLDSPDAMVSADAFVEIARTTDPELMQARTMLDRRKLRGWIADSKTPDERIGVYGLLLGLCGEAEDAVWLEQQLRAANPPERVLNSLGGLLCGLNLLAPERGWKLTAEILGNPTRNFSDRLNAISTLRFFQATRAKETRDQILTCLKLVIENQDLADLAIDDLRRWQWWDLTTSIFAQFPKPTHSAPIIRRGIVRYALQCPDEPAKAFLTNLRQTDPALVKKVEESLKFYDKN